MSFASNVIPGKFGRGGLKCLFCGKPLIGLLEVSEQQCRECMKEEPSTPPSKSA